MDPLGAEVGTHDPFLITPNPNYYDVHTDAPLYVEGGNPFSLGDGCGTIDGMPASCSEISDRLKNGSAVYDPGEQWGRRRNAQGGLDNFVTRTQATADQFNSNLNVLDSTWVPDYNDSSGDYVNDNGDVVGVISGRFVNTGGRGLTTPLTPQGLSMPAGTGQKGKGGSNKANKECNEIEKEVMGNPQNRAALDGAWTDSQYGTPNRREQGGLLGRSMLHGFPVVNRRFTRPDDSPWWGLKGFGAWAYVQRRDNQNIEAYHYMYHTHPADTGEYVPGFGAVGDVNTLSGGDALDARFTGIPMLIVSKTHVTLYNSDGTFKCRFKR